MSELVDLLCWFGLALFVGAAVVFAISAMLAPIMTGDDE